MTNFMTNYQIFKVSKNDILYKAVYIIPLRFATIKNDLGGGGVVVPVQLLLFESACCQQIIHLRILSGCAQISDNTIGHCDLLTVCITVVKPQ